MFTSTRLWCDIGDGLTIYQSCSQRLWSVESNVPSPRSLELVWAQPVWNEVRQGAQCFFFILTQKDVSIDEKKWDTNGGRLYSVFPNKISRLPPKREVQFSIHLIPGVGIMFVVPYRIALAELA